MQKLPRFINYITIQTLYQDSETTTIQKPRTIQKLAPFRNHDAEAITNQKQARFRNCHDSETTIQKLPQFRSYRQSETIAIQKLSRFRNYPASETEDKMISKFPPSWNFKLSTRIRYIKIPIPWNFKLTWTVHGDKMISKLPPPWNFK